MWSHNLVVRRDAVALLKFGDFEANFLDDASYIITVIRFLAIDGHLPVLGV
jgi:hypothetical protein